MPLLLSCPLEWPGRRNTSCFVASQWAANMWGCPSGKPTSRTHSYTKETAPGAVQARCQAQGHFKIQQSTTSDQRAPEPQLSSRARERMRENTFVFIHVVFRFSSVINSHSSFRAFFLSLQSHHFSMTQTTNLWYFPSAMIVLKVATRSRNEVNDGAVPSVRVPSAPSDGWLLLMKRLAALIPAAGWHFISFFWGVSICFTQFRRWVGLKCPDTLKAPVSLTLERQFNEEFTF